MCVALAACAGCGDPKVAVRGTVTVDGTPVELGAISFEPADGQGVATGGPITDGKYELTGNAAVAPGEKIVRIVGMRKTGRIVEAGPPAPKGAMVEELVPCVPSHFSDKSRLRVEIVAGKPNTHDFALDSKPPAPRR
jgi:hypothetical protein